MRDADKAAGKVTFKLVARRDVSGVRAAKAKRNAEALGGTDRNIGPEFPGRFQQRERQNIGSDNEQSPGIVRGLGEFFVVINRAVCRRILHQCAKNRIIQFEIGEIAGDDFDSKRFRAGPHNGAGLWMTIIRDEEFIAGAASGDRVIA